MGKGKRIKSSTETMTGSGALGRGFDGLGAVHPDKARIVPGRGFGALFRDAEHSVLGEPVSATGSQVLATQEILSPDTTFEPREDEFDEAALFEHYHALMVAKLQKEAGLHIENEHIQENRKPRLIIMIDQCLEALRARNARPADADTELKNRLQDEVDEVTDALRGYIGSIFREHKEDIATKLSGKVTHEMVEAADLRHTAAHENRRELLSDIDHANPKEYLFRVFAERLCFLWLKFLQNLQPSSDSEA